MADFASMSSQDLGVWLQDQGIPGEYCEKFEDNFIDGREFVKLTEDEVKQMVPPLGLAKKIIRMIPMTHPDSPATPIVSPPANISSQSLFSSPSSQGRGSTEPVPESDDSLSISSATALSREFQIPDSWPPSIMQCVDQENDEERKRLLVPSIRNEIVRVLATNMFCHNPNPRKEFCTNVAKMLVKKHKFMKDVGDRVSGYVSYNFSEYEMQIFILGVMGEEVDRESSQHQK
jgi:hypothetical protein